LTAHVQSALILFGLYFLIQTAITLEFSADPQGLRTSYSDAVITVLGLRLPLLKVTGLGVAFAVTGILFVGLTRTYLGKAILATYNNREVAQSLGINVQAVDIATYALATAVTAFAGVFIALTFSFSPSTVAFTTIIGFAVAVVGGKGSTVGILLGGFLVGIIEAATAIELSASWSYFAMYSLLLLFLAVRPLGLLGNRL
jgi:branched-chain amino acid transport system permease protein